MVIASVAVIVSLGVYIDWHYYIHLFFALFSFKFALWGRVYSSVFAVAMRV
jgi:hypothetical protein